jgi:hypothetical protein
MSAQINIKVDTGKIPIFITESVERQRIIKSYLKGEISSEQLLKHGIKFTNPFSGNATIR